MDGRTRDLFKRQIVDAGSKACQEQVLHFARLVQKRMVESGVDRAVAKNIVLSGFDGYRDLPLYRERILPALQTLFEEHFTPSNRGLDNLGRILTEFAFVRSPRRLLFPHDSDEEQRAREELLDGVLPRQLVRYFLASVRGTVPGIDVYESRPVLFAAGDPLIAKSVELADGLHATHRKQVGETRMVCDWEKVYADRKARQMAAKLLGEILHRLNDIGAERYLKIVDNLRRKDESAGGEVEMARHFQVPEVVQLLKGIRDALGALAS